MNTINQNASFRVFRRYALLVFLLIGSSILFANPPHGGKHHHPKYKQRHHRQYDHDYRDYGSKRYRHRDRGYDRSYARFSVPRSIPKKRFREYESYYYDRAYHPGHRHYHNIYSFPVLNEGRYVYRPHAYCDGSFFEVGIFTRFGPRFGLSIRF